MSMIYEPKGRAREYSPLALNIYNGCDHGCLYCFNRTGPMSKLFTDTPTPRKDFIATLARELERREPITEQVLLCFTSDPYCHAEREHRQTRAALKLLNEHRVPVSILTKGGLRCLDDLELFKSFGSRIQVGATLTCGASLGADWEPGAPTAGERLKALRELHEAGVRTWASFEPVIDTVASLRLMGMANTCVDHVKVGKWNHDERALRIDWAKFAHEAVNLLRTLGKKFYIKHDLRAHLPVGFLSAEECDMDALNVTSQGEDA